MAANFTHRNLVRIAAGLALAAAGVQAVALVAGLDLGRGNNSAEGWDPAGSSELDSNDLWSQIAALVRNGAGGERQFAVPFQLPTIWDTTGPFLPLRAEQQVAVMPATGTLGATEAAPLAVVARQNTFEPQFVRQPGPLQAVADSLNFSSLPYAFLVENADNGETPEPVPLPPALMMLAPLLPWLLGRRNSGRAKR
ncbi:MAG: hypothetical protein H6978_08195 [Gammaproteobacteria bacterium]|nr:hypothetical protein [Gammaproteobacteria bacterium]